MHSVFAIATRLKCSGNLEKRSNPVMNLDRQYRQKSTNRQKTNWLIYLNKDNKELNSSSIDKKES